MPTLLFSYVATSRNTWDYPLLVFLLLLWFYFFHFFHSHLTIFSLMNFTSVAELVDWDGTSSYLPKSLSYPLVYPPVLLCCSGYFCCIWSLCLCVHVQYEHIWNLAEYVCVWNLCVCSCMDTCTNLLLYVQTCDTECAFTYVYWVCLDYFEHGRIQASMRAAVGACARACVCITLYQLLCWNLPETIFPQVSQYHDKWARHHWDNHNTPQQYISITSHCLK